MAEAPRAPEGPAKRRAQRPRTLHLTSSIRMPWIVGIVAFLFLAASGALLLGVTASSRTGVPSVVLEAQEMLTAQSANSVRRSLNEGVDDLTSTAEQLVSTGNLSSESLDGALQATGEAHARYTGLYVVDDAGTILSSLGEQPLPALLEGGPIYETAGISMAAQGGVAVIQQYAPINVADAGPLTLVGRYNTTFLRYSLEGALPGQAAVIDDSGAALATASGEATDIVPQDVAERAAQDTAQGKGGSTVVGSSLHDETIVAWSPVVGLGPAGSLGLTVVTARRVGNIDLPDIRFWRQGQVFAIVLAALSIFVFSWLYAAVIGPTLRLRREAQRVAFGDLSEPVTSTRFDEVGLIARSLERLRVLLIRQRARSGDQDEDGD